LSSQLEIIQRSNNRASKKFKFVLYNTSKGSLTLKNIPDGWLENEVEYKRDALYLGVFRSISVSELTFYKEGRNYIQNVYELQGVDAEILVSIYRLNAASGEYVQYHVGKIDLATYKINEIGVSVQMIDNSFTEKFKNRDDVLINLFSTETIDGTALPPINDINTVLFLDTAFNYNANWANDDADPTIEPAHPIPMTLTGASDFTEAQSQDVDSDEQIYSNGFFVTNTAPRTLVLTGTLDWVSVSPTSIGIKLYIYDNNNSIKSHIGIDSQIGTSGQFIINETFDLLVGESVVFVGVCPSNSFSWTSTAVNLNETYAGTPEKEVYGLTYFDALMRSIEIITNNNTELNTLNGIISTPAFALDERCGYDGDYLGFILRGIYLREGSPWQYPLSFKFRDLFSSLQTVYNIGLQINDSNVIVIDNYSTFFDSNVILDISGSIRQSDIEKSYLPDWAYNAVSIGYSKYDYENKPGSLSEFNTKLDYSCPISAVKNQYQRIAPFRADNTGIQKLLNSTDAISVNSADISGDDDIFMVDSIISKRRDFFYARRDDGFTEIGGTIYANKSYNLLLSPGRCLRRHGNFIRPALEQKLNNYIRWQSTTSNTELFTKYGSETSTMYENADIMVNDLYTPLWYPEAYNVEVNLNYADKLAIDLNKHGLIKLGESKYGWILELKTNSDNGMAKMKLLRANLNYITPI
jgi:hypothetical protein